NWMQITRTKFNLTFHFDKKDWQVGSGQACRDFLAELKELIAHDHRDFDSSTNTWTINGSFAFVVDELREKCFVDPNQPGLF
ncbi:MAG: hypothetical protein ACREAB_16835, partial [Blastocatellia bacterium]